MKASYFGSMGYAKRHTFPDMWPVPPSYCDSETAMRSYQEGMAECEFAEEMGFDWISVSEHHFSGNRTTPNPSVMAAALIERCKRVKIALLGQLLPLNNPVRAAEEIGMLDTLSGGRLVVAFMRGTLSEDLVYRLNPAEGRERLIEAMDLVRKALTEPQPFSWQGCYYQYRTVSVWPRPVQQPLPPVIVATRSDDTIQYAATHQLGLGVSYEQISAMARITETYKQLCQAAGWRPTPEQIVYRGTILLAETDQQAEDWLLRLAPNLSDRGMAVRPSLRRTVQVARAGTALSTSSGNTQRGSTRSVRDLINFMGSPDTVVKQLKAFHKQCGVGVVDLLFQQPGIHHHEVMKEIELFGREVLPRIKAF